MQITASKISEILGGEILGDPDTVIHGPSKIEEAVEGTITFLANPKYEPLVYTTMASVILVPSDFEVAKEVDITLIKVADVYGALGILLTVFNQDRKSIRGISTQASVHASAKLGDNVSIGDFSIVKEGVHIGESTYIDDQVYIGPQVQIGKNVMIYPGVKIYHGCVIGDECIIHSNSVIGSDGFGFSRNSHGAFTKIPQIGNVILEKSVEIGACTVIDRATMGSTVIRAGAKLDNLIQIAHNVEIGQNTAIAAQAGVSGSTKIGKNCMIGGQAGFVGHVKIADNTMVQAQSGVAGNVTEENRKLYGYPAIDYHRYLRAFAYFKKLPEIISRIRELERLLDKLTNKDK